MKYPALAILVLLATAGCGKVEVQLGSDTIESRTFSAATVAVSAALKAELTSLCFVLNDKELSLRTNFVNSSGRFNYTISQSNCGAEEVTSQVRASVILVNGVLQYNKLAGDYFNSQVETRSTGVISALCADIEGLTQPLISGNVAMRYEVTRGSACSNDTNVRCVTIETALKQTDGQFLVSKVDRFQVDTAAGLLTGNVVRHEHWNYALCSENAKLVNVATFTGITN